MRKDYPEDYTWFLVVQSFWAVVFLMYLGAFLVALAILVDTIFFYV